MEEPFEIKKTYDYKKNSKKVVNVPRNIQDIMESSVKDSSISIHTLRIFSLILSRAKGNEIKDKDQYTLFSDEFLFENNTAIRFNYKLSDFAPKGTTSFAHVKQALKELVTYQINIPKKITRPDGSKITFFSGMISNLVMEEQGKVSFDMSSYWYCKFMYTMAGFNKNLVDLFFKSKDVKDIVFYTFLTKITAAGTTIKIENLNKKFNLNFEHYSELERTFLKPMRRKLNRISDISFNYSKVNNLLVAIKPYQTSIEDSKYLESRPQLTSLSEQKKINNKLTYLKDKHNLTVNNLQLLKPIFTRYSFSFINEILNENKKNLHELRGDIFLDRFTKLYMLKIQKENDKPSK